MLQSRVLRWGGPRAASLPGAQRFIHPLQSIIDHQLEFPVPRLTRAALSKTEGAVATAGASKPFRGVITLFGVSVLPAALDFTCVLRGQVAQSFFV